VAKVIGIDLGTTYSAVSVWDAKRKMAIIIPNLQGSDTTPSVVSLNEAGEVIVGAPAKENLWMRPEDTVAQIKREMGTDFTVKMGGETYNPQTISAFILRYLKVCAEKYLGEPVYDAVVTVPAYFHEVQKTATGDAGRIAGLNVHRLLNEPTAAAIAYGVATTDAGGSEAESPGPGSDSPKTEDVYAVYDLGGGTFDVSIIRITPEDVTVVGTGGDPRLGGLDMDEEVMKWAVRRIKEKHGVDLSGDQAAKLRLKVEAEGIKKALVASENATLNVPFLTEVEGKPLTVSLQISRAQFEMLIKKLLLRSVECLEKAMNSAKEKNQIDWEDLDGVLLVGGPTRLQAIRDILEETLRKHCPDKEPVVKSDIQPDEAVALGAAILAASLSPIGKPPETVEEMTAAEVRKAQQNAGGGLEDAAVPAMDIFDVTGHSLGLAVEGFRFHRLIDKETPIPFTRAEQGFTNSADFTTELLCQVYQGEDDLVAANTMIGEVKISGLDPLPRGQQMFEIKFTLDMNGTLSTICMDLRTKKTYEGSFTFDGITRMSGDEIRKKRELMARMADGANGPRPAPAARPGPAAPGDSAPMPAGEGVPALPVERIPADYLAYWNEAQDCLTSLDVVGRAALLRAINNFASAVEAGSAQGIEEQGYNLQDAVLSAKA
jgi:molecular chaperone DnaK